MEQLDLANWVIRENLKFNYSFTALGFATTALSIQFSPGLGITFPLLLILGWVLLMVSAFSGGYRILRLQWLYQIDVVTSNAVVEKNQVKVKEGRSLIKKEDAIFLKFYSLQIWTFLFGVLFNLVFAILNYLVKAKVCVF